jgi:pimeloyl-ACP methyl ester carboxylesterase
VTAERKRESGKRASAHALAVVLAGLALVVWAGACGDADAPVDGSPPAAASPVGPGASSAAGSGMPASDASVAVAAAPVQTTRVRDVELAWRSLGEGPPLVLIMGLGGTLDVWSPPFVAALARHYTLIVFDNRGMGRSSDGRRPVTIETMADDTARLMRARGYDAYAVLGFSMGSLVAQEVALRHPRQVEALILYATTPGGRQADLGGMEGWSVTPSPSPAAGAHAPPASGPPAAGLFDLARRLFPEEYRRTHPDYLQLVPMPRSLLDLRGFPRQIGALAAWRGSWSRLPRLDLPVLVMTGTEDELTPPVNAERTALRIPGSWLVRIRDGGHGAMYQYPAEMARVVGTFLDVSGYR